MKMEATSSITRGPVEEEGPAPVRTMPAALPAATPGTSLGQHCKLTDEPVFLDPPEDRDEEGIPGISSPGSDIPPSVLEEIPKSGYGSPTSFAWRTASREIPSLANAPDVAATPPPPPRRTGDASTVVRRRSSQVVIPSLEVDTKDNNPGNSNSGRVATQPPNGTVTLESAPQNPIGTASQATSTPYVRRLYTPPKAQQFDSMAQEPKGMKGAERVERPVRPSTAPPNRLPSQRNSPHIRNQYRPTSPRWAAPGGASYRTYHRGRGLSTSRNQNMPPLLPGRLARDEYQGHKSRGSPRQAKLRAGTDRAARRTSGGTGKGKSSMNSKIQRPKKVSTPRSAPQGSRSPCTHTSNQAPEFVVSQGGVSFTRTARFSQGIYDMSGAGADVDYDPYRSSSIEGKQAAMIRRQRARALLAMRKDQTERKRPNASGTAGGSRLASASSILNNTFYNPSSKASTGSRVGPGSYVTIAMLEKDWDLMTNTTASSFRSKDKRIAWLESLVHQRLGPTFGPGKYENFSDDFKGVRVHDSRRPSSAFASQSSRY